MNMRILITGGTGFIGSHVIEVALARGHEVRALRRPGSNPVRELPSQPEWVACSIEDLPESALGGVDAVLHLAATGVSPQKIDWASAFQINVAASVAFCGRALAAGIHRIVACGSCFEYGKSGVRYEAIPPEAPLEPIGPYASSKAAFSIAFEALAGSYPDASLSILRPFHLFGEGQHESNFWPSLRAAALAGADFPMTAGEQVRDFQPVADAARCFVDELERPTDPGRFLKANLGSGVPVTLREFAEQWWSNWNATGELKLGALPYREHEVMRFVPRVGLHPG